MPRFKTNQILSKVVNYGDRLVGHSAGKLSNLANNLKNAKSMGVKGVPSESITRAERLAHVAKGRSLQTRIKTIAGVSAGVGAGFLGLHKYHQHKDNKILARIDKMYEVG